MDHLDLTRWRQLLAAYRDAQEAGPAFGLLLDAQQRSMVARNDLEKFKARGPLGRVSERHSVDDIQRFFEANVRDLEARVADAERECQRIDARSQACVDRRAALRRLIDGIRQWAQAQQPPVVLPGDEIERPPTVSIQGPSLYARDILGGQPLPQRGGTP
jgi:hypothetical protein